MVSLQGMKFAPLSLFSCSLAEINNLLKSKLETQNGHSWEYTGKCVTPEAFINLIFVLMLRDKKKYKREFVRSVLRE